MDCLKSLCAQYLSMNLDVECVAEYFLLADIHQTGELKSKCVDYFVKNATKVMASEGWKSFVGANRIDLVAELLKELATSMNAV